MMTTPGAVAARRRVMSMSSGPPFIPASAGFFALQRGELGQLRAAAVFGGRGHYCLAIAPDGLDAHAVHGQAAANRLDEDVARAVLGLLDDDTQVGDQDQACVLDPAGRTVLGAGFGFSIGVIRLGRVLVRLLFRRGRRHFPHPQ